MKIDDTKKELKERGMEIYDRGNGNYAIRYKGMQVGRLISCGSSSCQYTMEINLLELEKAHRILD